MIRFSSPAGGSKIAFFILFVLIVISTIFSATYSIESYSQPSLSPSRSGAMSLIPNPAMLPTFRQSQVSVKYDKPYWGVGTISEAGLAANYLFINHGIGIDMSSLVGDMMTESTFHLMYGRRIGTPRSIEREQSRYGFFGGLSMGLHFRSYLTDNFALGDPDDPLFANGNSVLGISGGLGFYYREHWGELFLSGSELNRPNMALDENSEDKLPMTIQMGANFPIFRKIALHPVLAYHPVYEEFKDDISVSCAISVPVNNSFIVRAGGGNDEVNLKATYALGETRGFFANYEVAYSIRGLNQPSHRFGLGYRLNPPPPLYPDIIVENIKADGLMLPGQQIEITAVVTNNGKRPTTSFPVTFLVDGEIIAVESCEKVHPGDLAEVTIQHIAKSSGDHEIVVRADDNGENYPIFNSQVLETEEENNISYGSYHIYSAPNINIDLERPELRLTQLIKITEDEPMIPLFFFEKGESTLDKRFYNTVGNIAARLAQNPDAILTLSGYNGEDEGEYDGKLAQARANEIKRLLVEYSPEISSRVLIREDHDFKKPRVVKERFEGTTKGKLYTAQENRRVELAIECKTKFSRNMDKPEPLTKEDVARIINLLSANEGYDIIFQGPHLGECIDYERLIEEKIGSRFKLRIFSQEKAIEDGCCRAIVTAQGILYNPVRQVYHAEDFDIDPVFNNVAINFDIESELDNYRINAQIYSDNGLLVKDIVLNNGENTANWDWKNNEGKLVEPGDKFVITATLRDSLGQTAQIESDTLRVKLKNKSEVKERLILSQFTFAGSEAEVDFAMPRIQYLARKLIEKIKDQNVGTIRVSGHTDIVGVKRHNMELSEERALAQAEIFRMYMLHMLDMDTNEELDEWFRQKNFRFITEGYGSSKPYTVQRRDSLSTRSIREIIENGSGFERNVLIGDNDYPEGRIANRRVEIEFLPFKKR